MNQKEFMALLELGTSMATTEKAGKADWDAIIAVARKSGRTYTISQFHEGEGLVNGVVSKGRVRGKLDDLFKAKKVARLVIGGAYAYCFSPEAITAQHTVQCPLC